MGDLREGFLRYRFRGLIFGILRYFESCRSRQVILDGVGDMDVGYEVNDSGSKHPSSVYLSFSYYTVKLDLSCSSCNFY